MACWAREGKEQMTVVRPQHSCQEGRGTEEPRNLGRIQVLSARPRKESRRKKKKKKKVVGSQDWNGAGWKNSLPPFSFLLCEQPSALRAEPHRLRESRTDGENTWADGEERVFSRWSLCTCFDLEHTAVRVTIKLQTESSKDAPKTAICKLLEQKIYCLQSYQLRKEEVMNAHLFRCW